MPQDRDDAGLVPPPEPLPGPKSMQVYTRFLRTQLPEMEAALDEMATRIQVVEFLKTLPGISALVATMMSLASDDKDSASKSIQEHAILNLLGSLLFEVCQDFIVSVWNQLKSTESRSKQKLYGNELAAIVSTKAFGAMAQTRNRLDAVYLQMSNRDQDRYNAWQWSHADYTSSMIRQTLDIDTGAHTAVLIFSRLLHAGHLSVLVEQCLTRDRLLVARKIFSDLGVSDQQRFVVGVVSVLARNLGSKNLLFCSSVLTLFNSRNLSSHLLDLSSSKSTLVRRMVVSSSCQILDVDDLQAQFERLLSVWGSEAAIRTTLLPIQQAQTELLVLLLQRLPKNHIKAITSSGMYLNSVSARLSALSDSQRLLGTSFAELVSAMSDAKSLEFGFDTPERTSLRALAGVVDLCPQYKDDDWSLLESADSEVPETVPGPAPDQASKKVVPANQGTVKRAAVSINGLQPYELPSDDSDSDDDPTLITRDRIKRPVYIKDLVVYLLADDDYKKQQLALDTAADLIRRKATFGQELEFWAPQLATELVGLPNKHDLDDFEESRLKALAALVAARPGAIPQLLSERLVTGDYSLQQRMVILSSLSLGARELAGLDGPQEAPFPSKRLPQQMEARFTALGPSNDYMDHLDHMLQKTLLEDTIQQVNEHVSGPQVLRVSHKLAKERLGKDPVTRNTNKLSKVAAARFVFPLINNWQSSGGMRHMGTYANVLEAHFLKTLALVVHAAFPTNDIPDMTTELLRLVLMRRAGVESVVQEGVLTLCLVILEVNNPEFLVSKWPHEIMELKAWLEDRLDDFSDANVKGLAAGVLYKLTEITSKWQARLVGVMTGELGMSQDLTADLRLS